MLPVRTGTLVMLLVALLFGGLAVFIAKFWLASQQQQVATQSAPQPPKIETETLVVAKKDLVFGEPLTPEVMSEIAWPKGAKPQGSFTKIEDVSKDGSRVVLSPIGPNEPVLDWKISGPGSRASLSALVTKGMRAVTIRVNDTSGVAGFVLPGDRVDVLYTRDKGESATIDVLFQNVRVLAINQNADEKKGDPIDGRVATLELTPTDAQKLALAQSTGGLTFTLRAAGSLDAAPAKRIAESELVSDATVAEAAAVTAAANTAAAANEAQVKAQADQQAELERRLAGIEAKLKDADAQRAQQIISEAKPTTPAATEESLPTTTQITIYRGLQGSSVTVPLDANQ